MYKLPQPLGSQNQSYIRASEQAAVLLEGDPDDVPHDHSDHCSHCHLHKAECHRVDEHMSGHGVDEHMSGHTGESKMPHGL
jgi:hypothetical protein